MSGAARTRVAAYALCVDDAGRVLLCRMSPDVLAGEVWTLPGGGLAFGESPQAAVLRELEEETGQAGEIVSLVDVSDRLLEIPERPETVHAIRVIYRVRTEGDDLRSEPEGTTDACAWFTLEEATRLNLGDLARRAIDLLAAG
jgi:ADP-ribose pyrophosphatase YjhB (NUDIX family)